MNKYHLIIGLSRGGTNLIWTALASFKQSAIPRQEVNQICSSINLAFTQKARLELGSLYNYYTRSEKAVDSSFNRRLLLPIINTEVNYWQQLKQPCCYGFAKDIQALESSGLDTNIGLKLVSSWSPGLPYYLLQRHNPLKYVPGLIDACGINHIIVVIRSPLAQAEAWMRRGCSDKKAFWFYKNYLKYFRILPKRHPDCSFHYVKLESFLADPFRITEGIGSRLGLSPKHLDYLRVAKKPSLTNDYANISDKVSSLYTRQEIGSVIDGRIEKIHIERFSGDSTTRDAVASNLLYTEAFEFIE